MSFKSTAETLSFSLPASKPNTFNQDLISLTNFNGTTTTTTQPPLPTPTLELDQLSTQLERDKEISFLSDPSINYSTQCLFKQFSPLPSSSSCLHRQDSPHHYHIKFPGCDEGLSGIDSIPSCADYENTGSISNLDSFNFPFDFPTNGSVDSETTVAPLDNLKVPNNTPVDSLAVSGPDFALNSLNSETLLAILENGPLYEDSQDPSGWDPLFNDEESPVSSVSEIASTPAFTNSTSTHPITDLSLSNPEPPVFEMKFVLEKTSDIVFGTPDLQNKDKKRPREEDVSSSILTPPTSSTKKLDPIYVEDPGDRKAVKRARNTMAARRSRDRKRREVDELKAKVSEQEKMITQLLTEVNLLRSMNSLPPRA